MSSSHYSSDVMHIKSLSPHLFTTYVCIPCFPPFSKMFLTFIHEGHAAGVHLFLFLGNIPLYEDTIICLLPCDGCLSCFQFFFIIQVCYYGHIGLCFHMFMVKTFFGEEHSWGWSCWGVSISDLIADSYLISFQFIVQQFTSLWFHWLLKQ